MKRMLFNATHPEELRVASIENQRLLNFDIESSHKTQLRGNIYKGVITRVEHSLEACFVDYGAQKQGFLPFKAIDLSRFFNNERSRDISKLKEGLEVIVQVEKDERGNKGAALTTYISIPGRYLVLMINNVRSSGVSRRIEGEERDELKATISTLEVPSGMSVIARTAALGRRVEELQWDLDYLVKLSQAIKEAATNQAGIFLIYQESSLIIRSMRDHFSPDIAEVLIDKAEIYDQAKKFMEHVMPNFVDRVKFYQDDTPIFTRHQIDRQIESAYTREITLSSGGVIVIDHTEALTAIDINSARANKATDIEATALATNLEAAEEVARQMRLRDLGGLVVVDFIDMENPKNQREVENYFKEQLSLDRARIQMGKLSKFGLIELSRQRLQASLDESITITCPRCNGVGSIRGTESSAVHVLRTIEQEASRGVNSNLKAMHIQLPVTVATYLLNEKREDVSKIEERLNIKLVLIPNIHLDSPNYKIRKITSEFDESISRNSYELVDNPEDVVVDSGFNNKASKIATAAVKGVTLGAPAPKHKTNASIFGAIDKLVNYIKQMFNDTKESQTTLDRSVKSPPKKPMERNMPNRTSGAKNSIVKPANPIKTQNNRTNNNPNNPNKVAANKVAPSLSPLDTKVPVNNKVATAGSSEANKTNRPVNKPPRTNRSNANRVVTTNTEQHSNSSVSPITPIINPVNEPKSSSEEIITIKPKPIINDTHAINQSWNDNSRETTELSTNKLNDSKVATQLNRNVTQEKSTIKSPLTSSPIEGAQLNNPKKIDEIQNVGLGGLQMVTTSGNIDNVDHSNPIDENRLATRYNDMPVDKSNKNHKPEPAYEMVETKEKLLTDDN